MMLSFWEKLEYPLLLILIPLVTFFVYMVLPYFMEN